MIAVSKVNDRGLMADYAVEAQGLIKLYGGVRVVDGVDLAVPAGSIFGILGPNGAGKTTTLRMLLGIIDPDGGKRMVLGESEPLRAATQVGYLPEERGLYPGMTARDAIAFLGALRGMKQSEARRRAVALLEEAGLGAAMDRPIRTLSKGMAQKVQLLGTIVHRPRLIILDEPFSGLDALNQEQLEDLIRAQVTDGATVLFSTHVIAHAERLCERIAIIKGSIRFNGTVAEARGRLAQRVRLRTRAADGAWRGALPADAVLRNEEWSFALPAQGVEPILKALIDGEAGIESLSIERPSLHDAFVDLVGSDESDQNKDAA
jgi:ABC-2 type transport system ATP-binding protein